MGRKKKKSFMTPKASRRKARKRLSTTTGRVKKEFTYRGFSMEDLSQMELWPSENSETSIIEFGIILISLNFSIISFLAFGFNCFSIKSL